MLYARRRRIPQQLQVLMGIQADNGVLIMNLQNTLIDALERIPNIEDLLCDSISIDLVTDKINTSK